VRQNTALSIDFTLDAIREEYDAVLASISSGSPTKIPSVYLMRSTTSQNCASQRPRKICRWAGT
jgi:hypothetical protein